MGGGGGKGEKKKREKTPLFCFLFSQEAQESLRQWRRWGGDGGGGRQGGRRGVEAEAQVGPPAAPHPPGAGSVDGSSPDVPVQAQHALLAA